ncbi:MAG: hypothetical protein F4Z21_06395 [Acidobacteria bacterium]|nr:hypothetical protein [Acidobacteriota bacterium]
MRGTHLNGLEGTNPFGFLAALGVQELFKESPEGPALWWTDATVPQARTDFTVDAIVEQAMMQFPQWANHRALNPNIDPKADRSAKFRDSDIRRYLNLTQNGRPGSAFATALLAEGSLDSKGVAKPTDLYFTAGRLLFVRIAREILLHADEESIRNALDGPWQSREVSSLGWDPAGYIPYSLAPTKPGTGKKEAYVGVEALAILGMSRHPVFCGPKRTLTQGCSGSWSNTQYTWPLWRRPSGYNVVSSLLTHARSSAHRIPAKWFKGWGVSMVLKSQIRRTRGQGGGLFTPSEIIWPTE